MFSVSKFVGVVAFCGLALSFQVRADESVGASVAAGSGGGGGQVSYKYSGNVNPSSASTVEGGYVNVEGGALQKGSTTNPIGTAGAFYGMGVAIGDPALLHSNGVYSQMGISPIIGIGAGGVGEKTTFFAAPRIMLLHDSKRAITAGGIGGEVFLSRKLNDTLSVDALAQVAAMENGINNDDLFYLFKVGASVKASSNLAITASAEMSDLQNTKMVDDKRQSSNNPSVLITGGIQGAF